MEQLASRGRALAEIRRVLPDRVMRVLPGRLVGEDAVRSALTAADPKVESHRWFCDHALVDEAAAQTYVLSKAA